MKTLETDDIEPGQLVTPVERYSYVVRYCERAGRILTEKVLSSDRDGFGEVFEVLAVDPPFVVLAVNEGMARNGHAAGYVSMVDMLTWRQPKGKVFSQDLRVVKFCRVGHSYAIAKSEKPPAG